MSETMATERDTRDDEDYEDVHTRMLDTTNQEAVDDLVNEQLHARPAQWRRVLDAIEAEEALLATVELRARPDASPPDRVSVYDAIYRGPGGLGDKYVGQLWQTDDRGYGHLWKVEILGITIADQHLTKRDAHHKLAWYLRDLRAILEGDAPL